MRRMLFALALVAALFAAPTAAQASTAGAATLAAANYNKSAGTCAQNPTTNSLGGSQFEHSCAGGYSGGPEYWCADFAKWVWRNSGLNVSGLTAALFGLRPLAVSQASGMPSRSVSNPAGRDALASVP